MSVTEDRLKELARQTVAEWEAQLRKRGWQMERWIRLWEVVTGTVRELLESLQRPDWQETALLPLRVLRFLADQLNLSLTETMEAFLNLRRPMVHALTVLLGDEAKAKERLDALWDEGILRLTIRQQASAQTMLETTHRKYQALFERASDALFLVQMDDVGTIVEANTAAASLTGYSPEELHGLSSLQLVPAEQRERCRKALFELRQKGAVRLTDAMLQRKDGQWVIVDLSVALLSLDGQPYALCVARDITQQKRWQERLEVVVSERTKELAEALERERYRTAQMAVLAQIAAEALGEFNVDAIYQVAAKALREHLKIYDTALFALDKEKGELVLKAHAGVYRGILPADYRQPISVGILGWVARTGQSVLVNDVSQDPRYFKATPAESATKAELSVPIKVKGEVVGVLDLQSDRKGAFDDEDLQMAQAIANQMANAIETIGHFHRVRMFQELNEQIVENLPDAVALLNEFGRVVAVNQRFCEEICHRPKDEVLNHHWSELLPTELQQGVREKGYPKLNSAMEAALHAGQPFFFPEIPYSERWLDIRIIPARGAERRRVILYLRDASMRVRRIYQLHTLVDITRAIAVTIEPNRLLHAILTAATAGPGLGFNRAILFLLDKPAQVLKVVMTVGPLTAEEAYATWSRLAAEKKDLWDFLQEYPGDEAIRQTPLMRQLQDLVINMDEDNPLTVSLRRHKVIRIPNPQAELRLPERLRSVLSDSEAICVPLVAQEEPLGVIVADNAFNRRPITEDDERLLRLFAGAACTTLRNAQLIAELKEALQREQEVRERLVNSERLATIGELAAKIAHDLRSPLVTIGGYARQLQRNPSDADRVRRNVQIIVDEVERLERQLRDLLDFAAPHPPQMQLVNLTELVQRLAEIHRPSMEAAQVTLKVEVVSEIPPLLLDEVQIERVLLNLWRNAVEAMPNGGTLTVRLWWDNKFVKVSVSDTGVGIPEEDLDKIFKPFHTTKTDGTGLGLAICRKIIDGHGGRIDVHSVVGKGTTFTLTLPIP